MQWHTSLASCSRARRGERDETAWHCAAQAQGAAAVDHRSGTRSDRTNVRRAAKAVEAGVVAGMRCIRRRLNLLMAPLAIMLTNPLPPPPRATHCRHPTQCRNDTSSLTTTTSTTTPMQSRRRCVVPGTLPHVCALALTADSHPPFGPARFPAPPLSRHCAVARIGRSAARAGDPYN